MLLTFYILPSSPSTYASKPLRVLHFLGLRLPPRGSRWIGSFPRSSRRVPLRVCEPKHCITCEWILSWNQPKVGQIWDLLRKHKSMYFLLSCFRHSFESEARHTLFPSRSIPRLNARLSWSRASSLALQSRNLWTLSNSLNHTQMPGQSLPTLRLKNLTELNVKCRARLKTITGRIFAAARFVTFDGLETLSNCTQLDTWYYSCIDAFEHEIRRLALDRSC